MITNSLLQIIREGGYIFMIPLIALSILSLAVILERIFVFSKRVLVPSEVIDKIEKAVKEDRKEELKNILKDERSFTALVLQEALTIFQHSKGTLSLEKAITDTMDKHADS